MPQPFPAGPAGHFHTGVTAIRTHAGTLYEDRLPAAIHVGNGFGKLLGSTKVTELGELETPILLTGTLNVWKTADALTSWMLDQPGMEMVRSINPVVGETNDGQLSDIRARPLGLPQVTQAFESARGGPVAEGTVGAGAGTIAFGYKAGIGTSSRLLEATEEAILNSLFKATAIEGHRRSVKALPLPDVLDLLKKAGVLNQPWPAPVPTAAGAALPAPAPPERCGHSGLTEHGQPAKAAMSLLFDSPHGFACLRHYPSFPLRVEAFLARGAGGSSPGHDSRAGGGWPLDDTDCQRLARPDR